MWLELLRQAVINKGSMHAVAEELSISRTTVSLVLADKYPAQTDKIAQRVLDLYGRVDCPFLGDQISRAVCGTHQNAATPTSSPRAMKHWRACRACPNKESTQ